MRFVWVVWKTVGVSVGLLSRWNRRAVPSHNILAIMFAMSPAL